jgi:hypothetical protein
MKQSSKYKNSLEYQKAIQFLEKGCKCGCSTKIPKKEYAERRATFQNLSKKEQDAVLMGQLMAMEEEKNTTSSRFPKRERTNKRISYHWNIRTSLCQETYLNMLGISRDYLEEVRNHLSENNLLTRTHGNTGRLPQWKTKMTVDQKVKQAVKNFLEKYAEKYGEPDPGRDKRRKQNLIFLSTEMTYKSVRLELIKDWKVGNIGSNPEELKYLTFIRIWKEVTPNIKFRSPRSDLCDTCQQYHRDSQCSYTDEATKQTQKKNLTNT